MKQLEGNVAIVTGAGRGIGKAIAIAYGREGARVAVASRTKSTVDEVVKQIRDEGGEAIPVVVDVSERDQVFRMVDETVKVRLFGKPEARAYRRMGVVVCQGADAFEARDKAIAAAAAIVVTVEPR